MDLALIYLSLIGFGILLYALLDGFSLGVGIVSPWLEPGGDVASQQRRGQAMRSLIHLWDSNQTWLVFGGVTLYVGFPAAYAAVLSQLYLPVMLMLIALIFRGVAFEFRFKADASVRWWELSFSAGSMLAALCQGLMVGALVEAMAAPVAPTAADSPIRSLDWLTPFTLLTGLALMVGYGLLGCGWLLARPLGTLEPTLRLRSGQLAHGLLIGLCLMLMMICFCMLYSQPLIAERWLSEPNRYWLAPIPLLTLLVSHRLWRSLGRQQLAGRSTVGLQWQPLLWTGVLFCLAFIGLLVGIFPYIVPGQLTIWQAAAPASSSSFALVGIVLFLPIILVYNGHNFYVFHRQE